MQSSLLCCSEFCGVGKTFPVRLLHAVYCLGRVRLNYLLDKLEGFLISLVQNYKAKKILTQVTNPSSTKDTRNCPEKAMKITHLNQTNQLLLSIL